MFIYSCRSWSQPVSKSISQIGVLNRRSNWLGIIQLENNQFTNSEMDVSVSGSRNVSSIQRGCFSPFLCFDSGSPFDPQKRWVFNAFSVSTEGTHHTVVIHVQRKDPRGDFHRFRVGELGWMVEYTITKYLKKQGCLVAGFNLKKYSIGIISPNLGYKI